MRNCALVAAALTPPPTWEEQQARLEAWDSVDLLVPEWRYLQKDPIDNHHEDAESGLTLSRRESDVEQRPEITRVLAAERLRKVNALVGFTRIDAPDRIGDVAGRLVPLTRARWPEWTVATEDPGRGIVLQLDEATVAAWESRIVATDLWRAHRDAHRRNFERRFSETADRLYAWPETDGRAPAAGLLIVTTASDSDGAFGD